MIARAPLITRASSEWVSGLLLCHHLYVSLPARALGILNSRMETFARSFRGAPIRKTHITKYPAEGFMHSYREGSEQAASLGSSEADLGSRALSRHWRSSELSKELLRTNLSGVAENSPGPASGKYCWLGLSPCAWRQHGRASPA